MKNIKNTILLAITIGSQIVFADDIANRAQTVAALYTVVTNFAILFGLIVMALGLHKMKRRAENPNDPKAFPSSIIVTLVAGALIFNYSGSSDTMIKTLLGSEAGHCFVKNELTEERESAHTENCWNSGDSSLLGDMASRIDEMTPGKGNEFEKNIEVIVSLFQLFGMIYFIKGIYSLKLTSEGNGRDGYGKPIVTIIAAALVIDLPHTLETIEETITYLGFGGS